MYKSQITQELLKYNSYVSILLYEGQGTFESDEPSILIGELFEFP